MTKLDFSPSENTYFRRSQIVIDRRHERVAAGERPEIADFMFLREFAAIDMQMLADRCCELQDEVAKSNANTARWATAAKETKHKVETWGFLYWLTGIVALGELAWRLLR